MRLNDLKHRLDTEGFRKDAYYLGGDTPEYDGLVMTVQRGRWIIEYVERGMRDTLGTYVTEEDACEEFYRLMSTEVTARH